MPVLTITWRTHVDDRTCPFCVRLDGRQWVFHREDVKKARLPPYLVSPGLGIVWRFSDNRPRTHGSGIRGHWNCRCTLSYAFNLDEIGDGVMLPDISTRITAIQQRVATIAAQMSV